MGTKTIGLDDEAYEQLRAEKREGESFSDVVKRLTETVSRDWRRSFGKYSDAEGEVLEQAARHSREQTGTGLAARQQRTLEILDSPQDEKAGGDNEGAGQ